MLLAALSTITWLLQRTQVTDLGEGQDADKCSQSGCKISAEDLTGGQYSAPFNPQNAVEKERKAIQPAICAINGAYPSPELGRKKKKLPDLVNESQGGGGLRA
jgi:hypothetical protein